MMPVVKKLVDVSAKAGRCKRPRFDFWIRKVPRKRAEQPTPVYLPGECHGQRGLAGYSSWGHKQSDMTEWLSLSHFFLS